jgi:hypothetical protein
VETGGCQQTAGYEDEPMNITRKSMVSGEVHTLDLPVTAEQMAAYEVGALLQDAFPNLAPPEREFILTGITPEEWQTHVVGPPDDEETAE